MHLHVTVQVTFPNVYVWKDTHMHKYTGMYVILKHTHKHTCIKCLNNSRKNLPKYSLIKMHTYAYLFFMTL